MSLSLVIRLPARGRWTAFAVSCLLASPLFANPGEFPVLSLPEGAGDVSVGGYLFEARMGTPRGDGKTDMSRLVTRPRSQWVRLESHDFHRNYSREVFALRIAVKNESRNPIWYLGLRNNRLDRVDFRLETPRGIQTHIAGDELIWTGDEPAAFPVFRFSLDPGETGTLLVRLRSSALISFPVFLRTAEEFGGAQRQERLLVIGWGLIFLLMVAIQFLLNRRENIVMSLYFLAAMVFSAIWIWTRFGNGALYLYPTSAFLKHNGVFLFLVPAQFFLLLYIYKFLDLAVLSPRAHRVLKWTAIFLVLLYPIFWFDIGLARKNLILNSFLPVLSAAVFMGFFVALRAGRTWILHIFLGWIACQIAIVLLLLMMYNILPYSLFAVYGVVLVIPVWLAALMYGTAQRYVALKRERDDYLERMMTLLRRESDKAPTVQSEGEGEDASEGPAVSERERRVKALNAESLLKTLMQLVKEERLYLNDEISLEDFADRLGIRPDQLSALLNLRMGVSFSRLINQHRIDEAQRLLREKPDHNVLRIALDCGFGSRSAFNREFKRYTGMTPAAYREQASVN